MSLIFPAVAIIGESIGKAIDKLNFKINKIRPEQLIFLIFGSMLFGLVSFIFLAPTSIPMISFGLVGLIVLMIIISFAQNFFDFTGLSSKNLSLREPINNFEPVLASFLAYILFPSERNVKYIVAIILGVFILYFGNSDKNYRPEFDKGTIYLFLAMLCSAVLSNVYKFGLEKISPSYLFMFRAAGILFFTLIFFRIDAKSLTQSQILYGLGSGFVYFAGFLCKLYSIKYLGLNFTILALLISPVLIYLLSAIILKERIALKQVITSIALLSVIIVTINA